MMELFDEENTYTTLAEQWENYGTLNYIEDERRESLADSEVLALQANKFERSVVSCFARYSR